MKEHGGARTEGRYLAGVQCARSGVGHGRTGPGDESIEELMEMLD